MTGPIFIFRQLMIKLAIVSILLSCTRATTDTADPSGFSASSAASNVAVLLNAYGSTPGFGSFFERDLSNMYGVLSDAQSNYRFKTYVGRRYGHHQMLNLIRQGASEVSADGTLFVFITAHGSHSGQIQPEGQAYATLGYNEIASAVYQGRAGRVAFRRLVLFISGCYSGTWMYSLPAADYAFRERLVMTSVGPNQKSNIGQATNALLTAFQTYKNSPGITVGSFLATAKRYDPSMQASANSNALLQEPLMNAEEKLPPDLLVKGVIVDDFDPLTLVVAATHKVSKIEMFATKEQVWMPVGTVYKAEGKWKTVRGLQVSERWKTVNTVKVRVWLGSDSREMDIEIEHQNKK